jgi:phosphoserine phosphatase
MKHLGDLRVEAARENLRLISFFIQGIAQQLELTDRVLFDTELAVEEAATNIINHAYGEDLVGVVDIQAAIDGEFLVITLTDFGTPLDPQRVKPFDINAPVETRIHGGMGLHFIHSLMDRVEREIGKGGGEPNRLRLIKRIERETAQRSTRRRETRDLTAMQTVSEVMTANVALDDLLIMIVNKLVETIGAERGTLYLVDEAAGEIWSKVLLENNQVLSEIRLKIGEGIAGTVAKTGEILHIENAHEHPLFNPEVDKRTGYYTRNLLTVPIRDPHQKIIGVVQLLNKIDGAFTPPDARLLVAMASQAAISIENARLYQEELARQIIDREIQTAKTIQQSFLPERVPEIEGWDIAAFWKPAHGVAGDFYDFYHLEDGRLALLIADVSGKGIPSALFMALCVTVLRFGMSLNLNPQELIARANRLIIQQQRSRMFATVFVAYLDPLTGEVEFVSAGHNPPVWYQAATGRLNRVTAQGVAAGVFASANYERKTLHLEAHDILVLYTDGITEAINQAEEEFGEEHMVALMMDNAYRPAQEIVDTIIAAIHRFAGNLEAFDDETLIVVKRTPKPDG